LLALKAKTERNTNALIAVKKDHFFVREEVVKIKKYQFRLYFKLKKMSRYRS
jgi:hypothetical protein